MIVLEWLFFTMAPCDAAEPWQLGFQDAATPMMQGIIDLHHDIFFFLILIFVFVSWILVRALWHFHYQINPIPQRIVRGTAIISVSICLLIAFFGSIETTFADGHSRLIDYAEWADLPANQQPRVREPRVPPFVPVPYIPVLEPPLMPDIARRASLYDRIGPQAYVFEIPLETVVDLVHQQAEIERHMEACLIADGVPIESLQRDLSRLRHVLFSPQGTPLARSTLARYLQQISRNGTRQSIPYRRVYRAIRNYDLFIDLPFFYRM